MKPTLPYIYSLFLLLLSGLWPVAALAQEAASSERYGVVRLYGWPASTASTTSTSSAADGNIGSDTVPKTEPKTEPVEVGEVGEVVDNRIDSLSLGYGYRIASDRPYMTFALEWAAPDTSARIGAVTLAANIASRAVIAGKIIIPLTSLDLGTYPDLYRFELIDLPWTDVFEGASEEETRGLFTNGFELTDLSIEHIQFVGEPAVEEEVADRGSRTERRRTGHRSIYRPTVDVFIDIPLWRRPLPRQMVNNRGRNEAPRSNGAGRGANERNGDRNAGRDTDATDGSRSDARDKAVTEDADEAAGATRSGKKRTKKDDDDEEEDDKELLPAALVGVAAVAAIAVAGGTVGYFGNTRHAPIGLSAGMVLEEGGVMLQIGVNQAVLEKSSAEPERFLGRVISFYDFFDAPVKPALGLGAMVTEIGGDYKYELSVSPGLVGVLGPVILVGGYDVVSGGVDLGLAVNFKHRRR